MNVRNAIGEEGVVQTWGSQAQIYKTRTLRGCIVFLCDTQSNKPIAFIHVDTSYIMHILHKYTENSPGFTLTLSLTLGP